MSLNINETKTHLNPYQQFSSLNLELSFCFLVCARIDNNRREYCVRRAAQLCVHACVLRFFSFILQTFISTFQQNLNMRASLHHIFFGFAVVGCRARIDNNLREYCVSRAAQLCNYSCVLRFFFYFLSSLSHLLLIVGVQWYCSISDVTYNTTICLYDLFLVVVRE